MTDLWLVGFVHGDWSFRFGPFSVVSPFIFPGVNGFGCLRKRIVWLLLRSLSMGRKRSGDVVSWSKGITVNILLVVHCPLGSVVMRSGEGCILHLFKKPVGCDHGGDSIGGGP